MAIDDPAAALAKLRRYQSELNKVPRTAVSAVALQTKRSIQVAMGGATVMIPRARHARVSVGYSVTGSGSSASAAMKMSGAAGLLEYGSYRKPGGWDEPKVGKRLRKKRKTLVVPGVGPRSHVHHPPVKGKRPFHRGVEAVKHLAPITFANTVHAAGTRIFG